MECDKEPIGKGVLVRCVYCGDGAFIPAHAEGFKKLLGKRGYIVCEKCSEK